MGLKKGSNRIAAAFYFICVACYDTVTVHTAVKLPSTVTADITAVPADTPVTTPFALTVAFAGAELTNVRSVTVAFAGAIVNRDA